MIQYSKKNLFLVLFIYLVVTSVLYMNLPMSEDESNIYYVSDKWNEGVTPYKDYAGDSKTPGIYYYTSTLLRFTDNFQILRLSVFFVNILSAVFVFLICSYLFDNKKGLYASAAFLIINLLPGMNGYFFIVDRLLVLFSLAAVYFYLRSKDDLRLIFITGLLTGIALVFKQLAITLPVLFMIFYLCLTIARQKSLKKTIFHSSILIIGMAIPVILVVLHFAAIGGLSQMVYWIVSGVTNQYDAESIFVHPETITSLNHIYQFSVMAPFWISSLIVSLALIIKLFRRRISKNELFLLLWLVSTLHVMLLLLAFQASQFAPLAIMTALFFVDFLPKSNTPFKKVLVYGLIIFMIVLSASVNIYSEYNLQTTRRAYYQQEVDVSAYIQSHTSPRETIYVFGYRPSIFILSDRDPPANAPVLGNFNIQVKGTYENTTIMVLEDQKIRYIVHETMTRPEDAPVLFDYIQENYNIETAIGRFVVYRRK